MNTHSSKSLPPNHWIDIAYIALWLNHEWIPTGINPSYMICRLSPTTSLDGILIPSLNTSTDTQIHLLKWFFYVDIYFFGQKVLSWLSGSFNPQKYLINVVLIQDDGNQTNLHLRSTPGRWSVVRRGSPSTGFGPSPGRWRMVGMPWKYHGNTLWWTNIAIENGHRNSGFSH